jgi:ABC-2 type transport system permease protein
MRPAAESAAGTIYDIGYQRYDGARLGRGYAFRTLLGYSLRTAWGLGRGGRAMAVPFLILFVVIFPALLQVVLEAVSNGEAKLMTYTNYFEFVQGMVVLFCAAQAPELVSTDQHHRVLPLYFSRPLRRADYAAAKLLAMISAVWMLVLVPMLLLLAGRISAAADPVAALRAEANFLLPILGSTLTVAAVMGSLSIARRRTRRAGRWRAPSSSGRCC